MRSAERAFAPSTLYKLDDRGIKILKLTLIPDESGSSINAKLGYEVSDDGVHKIWTRDQVMQASTRPTAREALEDAR